MKTLFTLTKILLLAFMLQTCTDDENPAAVEKVQFTFDLTPLLAEGGRVSADLPAGVSLMISLQDVNGATVLDHQRIELLKVGSSYITQPIDLVPGRYKLTDFMLVNQANEVLYATPRAGSPFATAVVHPLPYSFNVSKDKIKNIAMEVVDVSTSEPEDFGYASFNVSVIEGNPFRISVFVPNGNQLALTTAQAFIMLNDDTLSTHALKATINTIFLKGDTTTVYKLIVVKEGYVTYQVNFHSYLWSNNPMEVVLQPPSGIFPFQLQINYLNTSYPENAPGDFEVWDYALVDFTLQNGVVMVTNIVNDHQHANPVYQNTGECEVLVTNNSSEGVLNIIGLTGYLFYSGSTPMLHLDFIQTGTNTPSFFVTCAGQEDYLISEEYLEEEVLTSITLNLTIHGEVYTSPDSLVIIDAWRME